MKYHTLKDAVRMGEYEPEYLSKFEEWEELTRHMQFQYIRDGIENRRKILMQQYVAIYNTLNFSQKPELQKGLDNNVAELEKLMKKEKKNCMLNIRYNKNMDFIKYEDFAKVEFRIGQIVEANEVEGSEKLLKLIVDFGTELGRKTVFSGIKKYYSPEQLLNKKTTFVVNIEPRKIMGQMSEAMIFGADDFENGSMSVLLLDREVPLGAKVF